jgi:transposase
VITVPAGVRIYLACGVTDMRKGFDGLSILAQDVLQQDPFSGAIFVSARLFAGRFPLDGRRFRRRRFASPAYSDEAGHGFRSKPDSDTTQAGQ